MLSLRKYITYLVLITLLFSEYGSFAWADYTVLHSFDELPSMVSAPSEPTDDFSLLLRDKRAYEQATPTEAPEVTIATETLTVSESTLIDERETYIASRTAEDIFVPTMTPGFVADPFVGQIFSIEGAMAEFLATYNSPSLTQKRDATGHIQKERKVGTTRGTISTSITPGTIITTSTGLILDASILDIGNIPDTEKAKAKKNYEKRMKNRGNIKKGIAQAVPQGFEFGLSGTHLIFSSPVAITVDMPNASDGISVDLMTEHAGDKDFHTIGLSVDATTMCNADGSASIPGSIAIVKNGRVTFYTCGASVFTMNTVGGTTISNDIKLMIGDCGQMQVNYKGNNNIYVGSPPATGCSGSPSAWPRLRVGATDIGNAGSTAWSTQTTTGSQVGNTYTATTTLISPIIGGLTYGMTINWSYTAPNAFFRMDYTVNIPVGNTQNVKFYYGIDSYVAGADANDVGYYTGGTNPTAGIYDSVANQLLAMKYLSGQVWAGYESAGYATIANRITSGANFNNTTMPTAGDLGFGVNWDFGTGTNGNYSSSTEWRMLPYVAGTVADLVPSIGQPTPSFTVNQTSLLPIVITNVGNAASTGTTTDIFTVPANFTGPTLAFTDNGWNCSATVGTSITCTKSGSIASLATDGFSIPIKPLPAAGNTIANFTTNITNANDSNTTNNTDTISLAVLVAPQSQALWLKADAGTNCSTAGCAVSAWVDQSGLGLNATQVTI
jgi:hypothetical protein